MIPQHRKFTIKKISLEKPENSTLVLEDKKRLSQSMLWKLQTDFYVNQGPYAWRKGIVPQYITTNPYIANAYAKTVFGYCRDLFARTDFNRSSTLYILELAAGVGRFTYTFLKRFQYYLENSSLKGLKFKYIMTDIAEQNVEYWLSHNFFKVFFDDGILDCSTFDMTKDDTLHLRFSGDVLEKGILENPLVLIANYAIDSVPQDTFYVNKGELFEGLITFASSGNPVELDDESMLKGLDYSYTDRKIQGIGYYEETNLNDILLEYQKSLENTAFSMPIAAIQCLERLKCLFGDDLVLIATDKGYRNALSMSRNYHPFLTKHGCISLTVNFHALELYFRSMGGNTIHSDHEHENVTTSLFLFNRISHSFCETELAFRELIDGVGPDDFYILKKAVAPLNKSLTTKELLTFLRFTVWDARTFLEFYNTLLERISKESDFPREELVAIIQQVWNYYFPIGEEGDLAGCLANILSYLGEDCEAIRLFLTSMDFYGEDAATHYEIALCYYNLQKLEKSMQHVEKSLTLEAEFEESARLKELIKNRFDEELDYR